MSKYKKIGIILILVGICIPLISFVFAEGYSSSGFWYSVGEMYIDTGETTLPYKYLFSVGIISILTGIGFFVLAEPEKDEK